MRFIRRIPEAVDLGIRTEVIPIRHGVQSEEAVRKFYEGQGCEVNDLRMGKKDSGVPDFEVRRSDGSVFRVEVKTPSMGLSSQQIFWRLDNPDDEYILAYAIESV